MREWGRYRPPRIAVRIRTRTRMPRPCPRYRRCRPLHIAAPAHVRVWRVGAERADIDTGLGLPSDVDASAVEEHLA